jgi:hypothetical protein
MGADELPFTAREHRPGVRALRAAVSLVASIALAACAQAAGDHGGPVDARRGPETIDAPRGPGMIDASVDAPVGPGTIDARPDAMVLPPDARPDAMVLPPDAGVVTGTHDTCAQALDITTAAHGAGGIDLGGDTTGYADNITPSSGCTGFQPTGPDAIYAITLAKNETVTATATPSGWDVSLELVQPCKQVPTCVAGADDNYLGEPETLTFVALTAGTYYLAVDAFLTGEEGPYTMHVKVQ